MRWTLIRGRRCELSPNTCADYCRLEVNEKNMLLTPFSIIDKLTGPYSFSKPNRNTLNEKSELYFHDFSMVPLFMQVSPARTRLVAALAVALAC